MDGDELTRSSVTWDCLVSLDFSRSEAVEESDVMQFNSFCVHNMQIESWLHESTMRTEAANFSLINLSRLWDSFEREIGAQRD